jgi:RHS repeat-associated protein
MQKNRSQIWIAFIWATSVTVAISGCNNSPPDTGNPAGFDNDTQQETGNTDSDAFPNMEDTESDALTDFPDGQVTPLDMSAATNLKDASAFLYSGDNPVQTGMDASIIDETRVGVLRGKVLDRENRPLSGVTVRIHGHPEFGETQTRQNGQFDMVVNGGQTMTVTYAKPGHLKSQRTLRVNPLDYTWLPDVIMIAREVTAHTVTAQNDSYQVVRGSVTSDNWGERKSTLLIPPDTTARATLPDGSDIDLSSLTIRSTEYTVGENGPEAMPATIASPVGYTYAVELGIDEADALGADTVTFSEPIPYHVENFLGFPAGTPVPMGYYDTEAAEWIPSKSGVVIDLVESNDAPIGIDADGDGLADSRRQLEELGISDDEIQLLSELYTPGQSVWRVMVPHFSTWDLNWPFTPPEGATAPTFSLSNWLSEGSPCAMPGSIIFPDTQVLGESIPIVGTDFQLHYFSNRSTSRLADYTVEIPLTQDELPPELKAVELEVLIAGQRYEQRFDASENLKLTYTWDGLDAYGRKVQGKVTGTVRVGYVYDGSYTNTPDFGQPGDSVITGSRTREEVTLWHEEKIALGSWDATATGLGGFSLNVHHAYNPTTRRLILGDGRQRTAESVAQMLTDITDPDVEMAYPTDIALAPDGRVFFTGDLYHPNQVFALNTDGTVTPVAGTGEEGNDGDGGPAIEATLNNPNCIHRRPDGTLLVCSDDRIRAIDTNGTIMTIAGGGSPPDGPEVALLATETELEGLKRIADAPDGGLYIIESWWGLLRHIDPQGIITTIVGAGINIPESRIPELPGYFFIHPGSVVVATDGNIYIGNDTDKIFRISPAGNLTVDFDSETSVPEFFDKPLHPVDMTSDTDGTLLITDYYNHRVLRWDGVTMTKVIGGGDVDGRFRSIPASMANLENINGIHVAPDGTIYIASDRIYKLESVLPGLGETDIALPSPDGSQLYIFDGDGRHLETRDALTQSTVLSFQYDEAGRLAAVTDDAGQQTVFNRNNAGQLTSITAPHGQETRIALDHNGRIETATDPLLRSWSFAYDDSGLLVSHTDAGGGNHTFSYNDTGLLISDTGATGFTQTLSRNLSASGAEVTVSTSMGRTRSRHIGRDENGASLRTNTNPAGLSTTVSDNDISRTITHPDGTVVTEELAPDIRWQMQVPFITRRTVTTPAGREMTVEATQAAESQPGNNAMTSGTWTETIEAGGTSVTRTVDMENRTLRVQTDDDREELIHFNSHGKIDSIQRSGLPTISYEYDTVGRVVATALKTRNETRQTTVTYDENGFVESFTDALGNVLHMVNDVAGRPVQLENANNEVTKLGYSDLNLLAAVTPPGKSAHLHEFDGAGMLRTYTPPRLQNETTITSYSYDEDLMLTQTILPDGNTIVRGYDAAGRLDDVTVAAGAYQFAYNAESGYLSRINTPAEISVTWQYDGPLRTAATWKGEVAGEIALDYDDAFRVANITVDGGDSVDLEYNVTGALVSVGPVEIEYGAESGLPELVTINDVETELYYNGFAEVAEQTTSFNDEPIFNRAYERDNAGRITAVRETIGDDTREITYTYDNAGRLVRASESHNGAISIQRQYSYDANGNRLSVTAPDGAMTATYDAQDRLIEYGPLQYTHGLNGDLQRVTDTRTGDATDYEYDELGQLQRVVLPDGKTIEYSYDLPGRRIAKRVNGKQTEALLYPDQLRPAAKLDASGTVVQQYMYATGINSPDAMIQDGTTYALIRDHIGSVRLVVDADSGEIAQRMDYDEFGNVTLDTHPGFQPFGFAGGLYDPDTALVHFNARDYNPLTGRWTHKDPIRFVGGDTNLYGYVFSDPVNLIDPEGLRWKFKFSLSLFGEDKTRTLLDTSKPGWENPSSTELDGSISATFLGIGFAISYTPEGAPPNFLSIPLELGVGLGKQLGLKHNLKTGEISLAWGPSIGIPISVDTCDKDIK